MRVNPNSVSAIPDKDALVRAGELIRQGKLVAFPTETVYGLGANALDPVAVERIYQAKGRPPTSPLIVHVSSVRMARELVRMWPPQAEMLASRYWPGPLTLVLPKQPNIPDIVTAGLPTVALRLPAHPVALALIRQAGVPIAAPSANRFTGLSPTTAQHVMKALPEGVDLVLDGGSTIVGIESTVLSLVGGRPLLLRPGMVTQEDIEALVGPIETADEPESDVTHPSPGMHRRHYSPATPLLQVEGGSIPEDGRGAYLWMVHEARAAKSIAMPKDATAYAATLYETLHQLDAEGWDWIAVEKPPETPDWEGVTDRIRRAASAVAGKSTGMDIGIRE